MPVQRGRKSAAKLSLVAPLPGHTYQPPAELTEAQAEVWRSVIATKEANWFTADSHPLLVAYCRHTINARSIAAKISTLTPDDAEYAPLIKLQQGESATLLKLAQSMRLTQLSRYQAKTASQSHERQSSGGAAPEKPWQASA